jgi:hypothetical protein
MSKRIRRVGSIKNELITKSREAMLTAVQIFNNPSILFKSESFIVLAIIAWTYMLHAYYRSKGIDYRYYADRGNRRKYDRTKNGAFKFWELERCLNDHQSPIDKVTKANLLFLIGLRHEIEHQMTTKIDDYLSARFQACCLNYNEYIKQLFARNYGIDRHLSFSLQFSTIGDDHIKQLREFTDLPPNIASYVNDYDSGLASEEFHDERYSYRIYYVKKSANHIGQADKVIEFVPANSPEAERLNRELVLIKEREKQKYLPSQVVEILISEGYSSFSLHKHTQLWKEKGAKCKGSSYGVQVAKTWYWYESWLNEVRKHLKESS